MEKARYTTEQIIVKLREVEILCGQGNTITEAARQTGITEQTVKGKCASKSCHSMHPPHPQMHPPGFL